MIPVLENTSLCYQYPEGETEPQMYVCRNNLENRCLEGRKLQHARSFLPLVQTGTEGTGIYLGFVMPPAGSPVKMLFSIAGDRNRGMHPLVWEYWNGIQWKKLNIVDGTEHLSRTGVVAFSGSVDFARRHLFGKERHWLRIRDAQNTYAAQDGMTDSPVLRGIHMNVAPVRNVYRRETEYFQMEVYQENKNFPLQQGNVYDAQVYVDEQGRLSEEEIRRLEQAGCLRIEWDGDGIPEKIWVKWTWVPDFSGSGPLDRHFVIHRSAGELAFGNGRQGRIPSVARRDNICISYCSGGGAHTNLEAGQINRMGSSIGYIHSVTNPEAVAGGCDAETPEEAVGRVSAGIRHQGRAVSARDYEELAMCAARDIHMVKCFAGYDETGKRFPGAVTLVVLQKQFQGGNSRFHVLRDKVVRYMGERMNTVPWDNRKFFVVPPVFIEVRLRIELDVDNFNRVFPVKKEMLGRLEDFFSPAGAGGKGWQIGSFPDTMQIRNAISGIRGIVCIRTVAMRAYTANTAERQEVDIGEAKANRYVLPVNGEHEIIIHIA